MIALDEDRQGQRPPRRHDHNDDDHPQPQLDRQLHLGHRGRRSPRCLRPRQVPRRHPPHDRAATPRRGARTHEAGCPAHEGLARQAGDRRAERNAAGCGGPGVLQHLAVHPPRPEGAGQPAASSGPTSRTTSTASPPASRTSSKTSNSATRSRASPRPTPWAR